MDEASDRPTSIAGNPDVAAARIEDDLKRLRRRTDAEWTIVLSLFYIQWCVRFD